MLPAETRALWIDMRMLIIEDEAKLAPNIAKAIQETTSYVMDISNVVEVQVSALRRKLDTGSSHAWIHTVRGRRYVIEETWA